MFALSVYLTRRYVKLLDLFGLFVVRQILRYYRFIGMLEGGLNGHFLEIITLIYCHKET